MEADYAVLLEKIDNLKLRLAEETVARKEQGEKHDKELGEVKDELYGYKRYGWVAMGVVGAGIALASSFENAVKFFKGVQ